MEMLWRSIVWALFLVTLAQASPLYKSSDGSTSLGTKENGYSLSKNVQPNSYKIKLEPHLVENDFTFNGESNIDVIINGPATNTIVLHAVDLEIEEEFTSLVSIEGRTTMKPTKQSLETAKEFLTIEFADPIEPGTYTLNLRYTGKLKEDPKGFYRMRRKINGQYVWEALTQFKTSYARRAFPCFDETAMTAWFSIWIKRSENYVANSTALAVKRTNDGDESLTHFISGGLVSTDEIDFKVVYGGKLSYTTTTVTWKPTTTVTWNPTTTVTWNPTTTDSWYTTTTDSWNPTTTDSWNTTTIESTITPTNHPPIPPTNQKCVHAIYQFTCTQCRPLINISQS